MGATPVERALLERSAVEVAPLLLGCVIRHGGVAVLVTEVEAYEGAADPGSHAYRGPTRRNASMFGDPGRLYAYFTYGMHTCANVVCSPSGTASAVLLRAGRIVEGADAARARRSTSRSDDDLARGPARLVVALGLTLGDDGIDLLSGPLTLEQHSTPHEVSTSPRTGVAGEGGSAEYPWRFFAAGDPTVSPYRRSMPRRRS